MQERSIIPQEQSVLEKWLYYDKCGIDSKEEEAFLAFIDESKEQISQRFSEWLVVRNDGFDEFKIYDNRAQLNFDFSEEANEKSSAKADEDCAKMKNPSY